ncbi:MAG: ccmE [Bacteroidetes bacterium]|nr:ccmE [Bacteroidota bacterium]
MKPKVIIAAVVVVAFIVLGALSFIENNVEYTDVSGAMRSHKKVQLKGQWIREKPSAFDAKSTQFTFFLVDDQGKECKVVLDGAAPNNFEMATSVVAKGRYNAQDGYFHATEVLTKCPSKYEAQAEEVKKST